VTSSRGSDPDIAGTIVVGSGLGALGATLALVEAGVVPLVVDVGRGLPDALETARLRMASLPPERWEATDLALFADGQTASRTGVPRKLVLGSDHFYAQDPAAPPHSFALGGFSAGWGGAFLPPRQDDLDGWPVEADELHAHARRATRTLPLSEPLDGLSQWFPPLREEPGAVLELGAGQQSLLGRVGEAVRRSQLDRIAVGQSRLMTAVASGTAPAGDECRRCGFCMSGCVYGSIMSSGAVMRRLAAAGAVELLLGRRVVRFAERDSLVELEVLDEDGRAAPSLRCERLVLGAGAVESARIVVRSLAPRTRSISVLRTGGAVIPLVSARRLPNTWPATNTQSSVFLDLVDPMVSPHWIHTQLAPANELVLSKLQLGRLGREASGARLRWMAFERLAYALVNLHSDHGPRYEMTFSEDALSSVASTRSVYPTEHRRTVRRATASVRRILRRAGLVSLRPLEKDSAEGVGYHLGGSLPMRIAPGSPLETDTSGRPGGCERVHVVDASVLPSLPGTTLGVLILANAHRIASSLHRGP
jgi:choline dehydrogenase-like flavoprotein